MSDLQEQRVVINFCVKLAKTGKATHEMLVQAYGDDAMSQTLTYEWVSRFQSGRTSVEDDPRQGRPVTARTDDNVERVGNVIQENRRLTIREISAEMNIYFGTCQQIVTQDLGMRRVSNQVCAAPSGTGAKRIFVLFASVLRGALTFHGLLSRFYQVSRKT